MADRRVYIMLGLDEGVTDAHTRNSMPVLIMESSVVLHRLDNLSAMAEDRVSESIRAIGMFEDRWMEDSDRWSNGELKQIAAV